MTKAARVTFAHPTNGAEVSVLLEPVWLRTEGHEFTMLRRDIAATIIMSLPVMTGWTVAKRITLINWYDPTRGS